MILRRDRLHKCTSPSLVLHAPSCPVCSYTIAGVLHRFGAAWAFWADALIYSKGVLGESYPFTYNIPGIVVRASIML